MAIKEGWGESWNANIRRSTSDKDIRIDTSKIQETDCSSDFIEDYRKFLEDVSPFISDEYLRIVPLIALSAVLGNSLRTSSETGYGGGLKPNLMVLLMGQSSKPRKSVTIRLLKELLKATGVVNMLAESFSVEALYEELTRHPAGIMFKDEFVQIMDEAKSKSYLSDVRQVLMKMFDGDLGMRHTKKDGVMDASDVAPCFVSATVPDFLSKKISSTDIASGFIPRFLLYQSEGKQIKAPNRRLTTDEIIRKRQLIDTLRYIYHTFSVINENNVTAEIDDEGLTLISEWIDTNESFASTLPLIEHEACYLKLNGYLYKFAMLYECAQPNARNRIVDGFEGKTLSISVSSINKAIKELSYYRDEILPAALDMLTTQEADRIMKIILRIYERNTTRPNIPASERGWVKHSDILRQCRVSAGEMKKILDTLVQSERLEKGIAGVRYGRAAAIYRPIITEKDKIKYSK